MKRGQRLQPRIKRALASDLSSVLATDRHGSRPDRAEYVRNAIERGCCWLVETNGSVAGYVVADKSFYGYPFVSLVVVAERFRRRGLGTALMRHAESLFPRQKLFTSTNESNVVSQRLMESLGFERSGRIENLDEGDPEIVYLKRPPSG